MASFTLTWLDAANYQISDLDKVDTRLAGLDYSIVTSIFDRLHVCVQPNQADPDTKNPPRGPLPISVWVCMCLFFPYPLRIPSGQETGFWEEERAGGTKRNGF